MPTEKINISLLFKNAGLTKKVIVKLDEHTKDNDLVSSKFIRKGWLYGAFLSFKEYFKRCGQVSTFVTIGTGTGIDVIGAKEILKPKKIIATDIHPRAVAITKQNLKNNLERNANVIVLEGDLCQPLIKQKTKADLIYANIPNIPSNTPLLEKKKCASYFSTKKLSLAPAIFQKYLLVHQHIFLNEAKKVLTDNGRVIIAIGGRVPQKILLKLFNNNGYDVEELVSIFKYQTEVEEVVSSYAKAEKGKLEFDFYKYSEAQNTWLKLENKNLNGQKLKDALKNYRVSATEALKLYKTNKCKEFGIVAHYLCGKLKK